MYRIGVPPSDDAVIITFGKNVGDPVVITVNCPDKIGLGCDLTRIIFEFGLNVTRGDLSTDGRWCWVVFWVVPRMTSTKAVRWNVLKKWLSAVCPSSESQLYVPPKPPKSNRIFLLQVCCADRKGLLHDVSQNLWELELTIHKVKVSTTPHGEAIDMFFVTDNKDVLPSKDRVCDIFNSLQDSLGASCELAEPGPECGGLSCTPATLLPPHVAECLFSGLESELQLDLDIATKVTIDNLLSPAHTLLQISCKDRKGLLYDALRTLKDFNMRVAYGRLSLSTVGTGRGEIDLFITQADGRKVVDPEKQNLLCSWMTKEIDCPLRVVVVSRGADPELLVATPIEFCGRGRPRVLYDVTLALKILDICIFQADIGRHTLGDRHWEVYRFVLIDTEPTLTCGKVQNRIADRVRSILMG